MSDLILRAGEWFLRSGIQEPSGGVARYYRSDLERNAPVSNEITGYAASTLVYLRTRTGLPEYGEAALRAGRYLKTALHPHVPTFPFEPAHDGTGLAYFFDCGIIIRGLNTVGRAAGDGFGNAAGPAAESMRTLFAAPEGWHPVLDLPACTPIPAEDLRWSRRPGCYQLKSALAWLETGHTREYEATLAFALRDHAHFLPGVPEQERIMDRLHAYCYFLEGLLPVAGRPEAARALAEGIERVSGYIRQIAPVFARSDVYAQLLRVRLFAGALGAVTLDARAAEAEAAAITTFQISSQDPRTNGCFAFGTKNGALMPYANPVSTAFCLQALAMWDDYRAGRFNPDWRLLI